MFRTKRIVRPPIAFWKLIWFPIAHTLWHVWLKPRMWLTRRRIIEYQFWDWEWKFVSWSYAWAMRRDFINKQKATQKGKHIQEVF